MTSLAWNLGHGETDSVRKAVYGPRSPPWFGAPATDGAYAARSGQSDRVFR